MSADPLEDFRWLASEAGAAWLARAAEQTSRLTHLAKALRKELSAERTHRVLEQLDLRHRAREKFSRAGEMLFTRQGLEQSSGESVAEYKGARFAPGLPIFDLCTGIGGDLLALAARGPAEGIDRDPLACLLAEHNCRVYQRPAKVRSGEAGAASLEGVSAWHIDPDRRAAGRRTTRVELGDPGAEEIERLLARNGSAAIKLAPAAIAPEAWAAEAELEWLGERGECRQQVAWFGNLARRIGQRSATVIGPDLPPRTIFGRGNEELSMAERAGRFVHEPQAAVLAARLAGALAAEHGLAALADCGGYLTGDREIADSALASFAVLEELPLDLKRLRGWLRARSIGRIEVKKRGLETDPAALQKQLSGPEAGQATVLLIGAGRQRRAIVARRLSSGR